ncbi:MAG: YdeI/OmpD-associated family protein [Gemmatimonadetes bacterium]|nr:YdeI/OmpD-associated family protein [Gemmatimonadota bacterium]
MSRKSAGAQAAKPVFFASSQKLRQWLQRNHASVGELWVGLYKKGSGKPSITWPELVDQLLCFGWIDGVRKYVDQNAYTIRVTPRKSGSIWSAVNTKRANELIELRLMQPAGRAAFDARDEEKTKRYSFQRTRVRLGKEYESEFRANRDAWEYFQRQPPGYRKMAIWWVVSAKQEDTRRRRLATLISDSEQQRKLAPLRRSSENS